jgi:hypothetical protein
LSFKNPEAVNENRKIHISARHQTAKGEKMLKKPRLTPKYSLIAYVFIFQILTRNKVVKKLKGSFASKIERFQELAYQEQGDVPGWVLVVLMTTGLVTGIWTVAQPRLSSILRNSLDNMNSIR